MHDHVVNQIFKPALVHDNTLHVIGVISNSPRYHSRYRLFRKWIQEMEATPHVKLYLVELAFGDRNHEVTSSVCPNHLQLRTPHEIWHKENMINLGVEWLLPKHWRYMAWVDTDIHFRDPNWAQESLHQLQHYQVIQPWSQCADLGPQGQILQTHNSFGFIHSTGMPQSAMWQKNYHYGHSGYAWACTRRFWNNLPNKGLIDFAILGSADHHMAWATIGRVGESMPGFVSCGYDRLAREWQRDAIHITKKRVGFVQGRIEHHFHGSKKKRYYRERWQILKDHHYDPEQDLAYDESGVTYLLNKPELEHEIHKYFRSRHEDGIDE